MVLNTLYDAMDTFFGEPKKNSSSDIAWRGFIRILQYMDKKIYDKPYRLDVLCVSKSCRIVRYCIYDFVGGYALGK